MKMPYGLRSLTAATLCVMTSAAFAAQVLAPDPDEEDLVPTGKGWGERATPTAGYVTHGNGNAGSKPSRVIGNGIVPPPELPQPAAPVRAISIMPSGRIMPSGGRLGRR